MIGSRRPSAGGDIGAAQRLDRRLQAPDHFAAALPPTGSRAELVLAVALLIAFTSLMAFFAISLRSLPFIVLVALWGASATAVMAAAWRPQS